MARRKTEETKAKRKKKIKVENKQTMMIISGLKIIFSFFTLKECLNQKKCRARFGLDQQVNWCKHCK